MQMSVRSPTYRFGAFSIDPAARELRRDGAAVPVAPKVFECIVYLLENRQRAIGKDELVAAVWGQVSAGDSQIAQTILRARRALDEDDGHNVIQTLPRFGYRWVAPVSNEIAETGAAALAVDAAPAGAPAPARATAAAAVFERADAANETDVATPAGEATAALPVDAHAEVPTVVGAAAGRRRRAPSLAVFGMTALAAAVALGLYLLPPPTFAPSADVVREPSMSPAPADTFAVLPIDVQSLDADSTWLGIGLMEIVAAELRRGGLAVVPARTVLRVDAAAAAASDAALRDILGADNLVRLYVRRTAAGWSVRLMLGSDRNASHKFEAVSANVVDAGKRVASQLLLLRGKTVALVDDDGVAVDELVARINFVNKNQGNGAVQQLVEAAPAALREHPRVQLAVADADMVSGNLATAEPRFRRVLEQHSSGDAPELQALATVGLASVEYARGNRAEALRLYDTAITLRERAGDWSGLAYAHLRRAIGRSWDMDLDGAAADLAAARVDAMQASDRFALARVEANQGLLAALRGRHAEAVEQIRDALPRLRRFGAYDSLISGHAYLVEIQLDQLKPREALATSEEAWPDRFRVVMTGSRNDLLRARAKALLGLGRLQAAGALIRQIEADGLFGEDVDAAAQFALLRALYAAAQGDRAGVREQAGRAVAGFGKANMDGQRSLAWLLLVRALQAEGRRAEADEQAARFSRWSTTAAGARAFAALAQAELAQARNDLDEAWRRYDQALSEAEAGARPSIIVEVAVSYGQALIDRGQTPRVKVLTGLLARFGAQSAAAQRLQLRYFEHMDQPAAVHEARERLRTLLALGDTADGAGGP
jgi:DNA-binding winged helix-turn-helix (wHTH) protein/tetratricopeptide (TPR) repeat protein